MPPALEIKDLRYTGNDFACTECLTLLSGNMGTMECACIVMDMPMNPWFDDWPAQWKECQVFIKWEE